MELERKLVAGPFHPELERAFFQTVLDLKVEDPLRPVAVLVGSNLLQIYLRRKMAMSIGGHVNVRFVTFIDLACGLADGKLEDSGRIRAPVAAEEFFAKEVCSRLPSDGYFHPIQNQRGFHRLLRNVFSDLRLARMEVENIICLAGTCDDFERQKLQELALLYREYKERLSQGAYDERDLFRQAAEEVPAFQRLLGTDVLLIYGMYDFNAAQRNLLESLFHHLHVLIFLPWEPSRAYRYANPTLSWLKRLNFSVGHALEPKTNHSIDKLRRRLFTARPQAGTADLGSCVTVVGAHSEAGEIREVAREILRLAREGIPFQEMGILLRNREPYARLVQEIFEPLRIPYCLIPGVPLDSTSAGRGLRMLLELASTPLRRFEVMEFITSAPIPLGDILECAEDECSPAEWDVLSMEAGIVQGREQWIKQLDEMEKRCEFPVEEEEAGDAARVREEKQKQIVLFRRFMNILLEDLDSLRAGASWSQWVEHTLRLIRRYILSDSDGLEEVQKAVEEFRILDNIAPEATIADFREAVARTLAQKSRRMGMFQRSGVHVCGLMESRGISFRVLFVPGLADGVFPAPIRPDPILSDVERQALGHQRGDSQALKLQFRRHAEEKLLFMLAVGAARERLILTHPRLEPVTGRARAPSGFLFHLAETLEGKRMNLSNIKGSSWYRWIPLYLPKHPEDADALDEGEYHLARLDEDCESALRCLERLSPVFRAAREAHASRHAIPRLTPYDGALLGEQAHEILRQCFHPARVMLSLTALEDYARCPFRYYLRHVLFLDPLQEPELALTFPARERGRLVHWILRDFYQQIVDSGEAPLLSSRLDSYRKRMLRVVDRWCEWQKAVGLTGHKMAWELEKKGLRAEMEEFIHEELAGDGRFIPRYVEVSFPPKPHGQTCTDLELTPLKLQLDAQTLVTIQGRVDRIDLSRDGRSARIVDYKSGRRGFKPQDFRGGRQIQLPVYALAARQILTSIGVHDVEAQYYYIGRQGGFRRDELSSEDIHAMEDKLQEIVAIIVQGILSGLFMPAGEEDACRECDYKAACGSARNSVLRLKKNDPALAPFQRLRSIRAA